MDIFQRSDPHSIAMRYIFNNLGLNIRAVLKKETDDDYIFQLDIHIPYHSLKPSHKAIIPDNDMHLVFLEHIGDLYVSKKYGIVSTCITRENVDATIEKAIIEYGMAKKDNH